MEEVGIERERERESEGERERYVRCVLNESVRGECV